EKTQRVETDYETTGPETIEKDGKTYELVEVPSNAQGTVGYDPIEVNYVYREVKKDPEDPENSKDPKDPEKEKDTEEPTKSDSNKNGESNIPSLVTDKNNGDQAKKLTASLAGNQVVSKGTNNSLRVYPKMNESGSKILMIIGTGLSSIAVGMWLYRKKR
ncbi:MucBP domain-containing protein, partial [Enterococcus canis]